MAAGNISEVISQLDSIVRESALRGDRAGYFAALYKNVTLAVAGKIQEGYFEDNVRMERLDVVFANRYLEAYEAWRTGRACTQSWQTAFDACREWKPMVIHHLMTGMNAHIGLDLGIAAATIAPGPAIGAVQADFNRINTILNSLVQEVKTDLFSMFPVSSMFQKIKAGNLENEIAGFSMEVARDAAWKVALAYASLTTAGERDRFIGEKDAKVAAFGKKLLRPGSFLNALMYGFRLFETGSVADKIKRLNERNQ